VAQAQVFGRRVRHLCHALHEVLVILEIGVGEHGKRTTFRARRLEWNDYLMTLPVPGAHNVRNAAARHTSAADGGVRRSNHDGSSRDLRELPVCDADSR
jgi:hypothetical protein